MGRKLQPVQKSIKIQENKILGCQSNVYLSYVVNDDESKDPLIYFSGVADTLVIQGLLSLLVMGLNGSCASEIMTIQMSSIHVDGLAIILSPSRANGFVNILARIKEIAQNLLKLSK